MNSFCVCFFFYWRQFLPHVRGTAGFWLSITKCVKVTSVITLSFQLSLILGKDLNADHYLSCLRLQFAKGSAIPEPLTDTIPNARTSSSLAEFHKNRSKKWANQSKFLQTTSLCFDCKLHQSVLGDLSQQRLASDQHTSIQISHTDEMSCESSLYGCWGGTEKEAESGSSLEWNASNFQLKSPRIKYSMTGAYSWKTALCRKQLALLSSSCMQCLEEVHTYSHSWE